MIATHLHVLPDEVREMTYIDYNDIVNEIGIKINYESISNLLGNGYVSGAGKIVNDASPFNFKEESQKKPQRMTKEMAMAFMGQSSSKNKQE